MSNENKTIHDFELNLICDFFSNMERQGPGSPEATLKALSFVDGLTDESFIADIGCGTGGRSGRGCFLRLRFQDPCQYGP